MSKIDLSRRKFVIAGGVGIVMNSLLGYNSKASSSVLEQCLIVPSETDGPYPAHSDDRGVNYLTEPGAIRRDIRGSIGASEKYSGTAFAEGLPLTLKIQVLDSTKGCAPLANSAVYIWHCDGKGDYSMYNDSVLTETYLRGVQITDDKGWVEFETIYPGCYDSRAVHIHFDVFKDASLAINNKSIAKISQIAFPDAISKSVYELNQNQYPNGLENLNKNPLNEDGIFSDGYDSQLVTITSGSANSGYTATLTITIDPNHIEESNGGPGGPGGPPPGGGGRPPGKPPRRP